MSKRRGQGFQKRTDPKDWTQPRMALISYYADGVKCSCGWFNTAKREKVREDAIDRHLDRRHNGRGVRM